VYNPYIVGFRKVIQGRVGNARAHYSTANQDDSVAVRVSKVGIGETILAVSTCFWIWRKNIALMETTVAEKLEYRHGGPEMVV
jgi:hypothetical protein